MPSNAPQVNEDLTESELDQIKGSFARIAVRSGIGDGALREVEAGLGQAEQGIDTINEKNVAEKEVRVTWLPSPYRQAC
jgi:hypothetical protein